MGPGAMILVFWMLSFKPTFSLSSFTFIKRLYSSSSLSAKRVVSSTYLRLLIFLWAILISACASPSPAFLMMYSTYKLNKQGDNIQPWSTPFPIWNQSVIPCPVLTVASWPAYRFIKRLEYHTTLPASWEIYMQVKKQQLKPDMEQQTCSKPGKGCDKDIYFHHTYLTAAYIMGNTGLDEAQAGIRIVGRNINNLR